MAECCDVILRQPRVLDDAGDFTRPTDVRVSDGIITELGQSLRRRPGEEELDCTDLWLLPGIFDCHAHPAWSTVDRREVLETPLTYWALEAARNLRNTLFAGVTFVRDASGSDAGLRNAIRDELICGPTLQLSINMLSQTGGHGDEFLPGVGLEWGGQPVWPGRPPCVVDGEEEMRRAVRQCLRAGADWIKLSTTGGIVSPHDEPLEPQLSRGEIEVAVEEARRKGRPVMAHAFGGDGLTTAVRAGVRSIEHGVFLSEEDAAEMARHGCFLVPTLRILKEVVLLAEDGTGGLSTQALRKVETLKRELGEAVAVARAAGVKIAVGTDCINRDQHGRNTEELGLLHAAGLSIEEVLLAATCTGAELCGVQSTFGRLAPGYVFDAIAIGEDPAAEGVLDRGLRPEAVFQRGRLVKGNLPDRGITTASSESAGISAA
jgi:imidazolonepropionase-like amidohydrolase